MTNEYTQKLILSGNSVERYKYPNKIFCEYEYKRKSSLAMRKKKGDGERRKDAISRARNNLRRLIECNPQLNKYITFTFDRDMFDVSVANSYFTKFVQRLKYNLYPDLKYISVMEFQKDIDFDGEEKENGGSVHYHSLFDIQYTPQKELLKIWGHGTVCVKRTYDSGGLGGYLSNYLEKDDYDSRFSGKKKYFASRNICRPVVIKNDFLVNDFMDRNTRFMKLKFACGFKSKYAGEVLYYHYYGNRNLFATVE